jgi:predicted  nucleic acid-binding Zn-ribbon protein
MTDRPSAMRSPQPWYLGALLCLNCLVLGGQASALPPVQIDSSPGFLLVQAVKPGEQSGSEQQAQQKQQAPFAKFNDLLEDTQSELDELFSATAIVAEQRKQIEALKQETERLAGELEQANTRRTELESSRKVAEGRIAELSKAIDVAVGETVRLSDVNADLEQRVARAETARETAQVEAQKSRTELQAKLEAATDAAEQSTAELAELRKELERTGRELAAAVRVRQQGAARAREMEQALKSSGAEAERGKTELAEMKQQLGRVKAEVTEMKQQLGQAASAAVEAERAREAASSEADQLRGEAERAREELAAAKGEMARFRNANAELEKQLASLHAESASAIEKAGQKLTVMKEKIEQLQSALEGAGLVQTAPAGGPQAKPASVAQGRSTGSNLVSGKAQPAATAQPDAPGDEVGSEQAADSPAKLAAIGPGAAPAPDEGAGLERFDATIRYLNSRALELEGADLFSDVKSAGNGVVHVSTTPAWRNIPPAGQRSYLDSLFDLWTVAHEGSGPAVVRIVDANGRVLLEKSRNAQDDAAD